MSVIGAFLTQFDVKTGNVLLWNSVRGVDINVDFSNVEYLSLPSGIHDNKTGDDLVRFVLKDEKFNRLYPCLSMYYSNTKDLVKNSSGGIDRSQVRIYGLGIVCEDGHQNIEYIEKYIPELENIMSVMDKDLPEFAKLEDAIFKITPTLEYEPKVPTKLFKTIGPLIFQLWKACLLNERLLLLADDNSVSFAELNYLTNYLYKISDRTSFESDEDETPSNQDLGQGSNLINQKPLYNVGLFNCVGSGFNVYNVTKENSGFIAYSSDLILKDMNTVYDKVLYISRTEGIKLYDNRNAIVKSTFLESTKILQQTQYQSEGNIDKKSWFQAFIDFMYTCTTMNNVSPPYMKYQDADIPVEPPVEVQKFVTKLNAIGCCLLDLAKHDRKTIKASELMQLGLDGFSQQDIQLMQQLYTKLNKQSNGNLSVTWFDIGLFI